VTNEDTHFYIDNAPFSDALQTLQLLSLSIPLAVQQIEERFVTQFGITDRKFRSEWPKRLNDLGLARQGHIGRKMVYELTPLGLRVRELGNMVPSLYPDLMHYLHFTGYIMFESPRKYLWSYRLCSQYAWRDRRVSGRKGIAAQVQNTMRSEFPHLDFEARVGARFDDVAVGRWFSWVQKLEPIPFSEDNGLLMPRVIPHHELALLALDDVYRSRGYRYGDPVILDDDLLDAISAVFFLDTVCCRELVDMAARLTRAIRLGETFAGTSVTLLEPYTIERI
jgi:hypothetical protein